MGEAPNGNGRRVSIHWVGVAISAAALLSGIISAYASLRSDIAENRRAHEELTRAVARFEERTERWQAGVAENDRETRTSIRLIAEKLVDFVGKN